MFGDSAIVRGTAGRYKGHVIERFSQGSFSEGLGHLMHQNPEVSSGICKSLCMHWVAHHANDEPGRFSDAARQMGSRGRHLGGKFAGVIMAMDQLRYAAALKALPRGASAAAYDRAKDKFTDEFLREQGIVRQMKMHDKSINLSLSDFKFEAPSMAVDTAFGWEVANSIAGMKKVGGGAYRHHAGHWSYKIISLHGRAGGHAVAAFVGADAMFFDPNYGVFYFPYLNDFRRWFGAPGGFYWATNYVKELGSDFTIKSYAKSI